jgi:phi13 family phage major tail protein
MSDKSVQVGLRDLHYATCTDSEDAVSYGTPTSMAKAINAKITPTTNTATLYANDGADETDSQLGEIGVEIQVKDLTLPVQAALLGHTVSNGVLVKKASDVAPYVAIGFKSVKANGSYRFVWLLKGRFMPQDQEYQTKNGTPQFQTPTIKGTFIRRQFDEKWQFVGDEDETGFSLASTWFDAVPTIADDTTAPTISSVVPAADATSIAVGSTVKWTFDEAIAADTVNGANFIVQKSDGSAQVAGALSQNADGDEITFTPSANLSASTEYMAIVTTGVKDLSGNALAATSATTFTTA